MPRVIITVPDKTPQPYRFQLDRKVVSLGRGSDNDIVIDSGSVSGKHAEMHRVIGGYELADKGSTNGVKYGETRQDVVQLHSGISVKLGDVAFDFTLSEEELELLASEKPAQPSPVILEEAPVVLEEAKPAPEPAIEKPHAGEPVNYIEPDVPSSMSYTAKMLMIVLFLILAAVVFFVGLDIRHRKDTGESILKGIANKSEAVEVVPDEEAAEAPEAE